MDGLSRQATRKGGADGMHGQLMGSIQRTIATVDAIAPAHNSAENLRIRSRRNLQ
jgi:hypothetical protein